MGKYMRKTKVSGELAVMEVPHQSPLGVRTRARTRTLALQRLHKPPPDPATPSSYLQLRNRRLEKSAPTPPPPPSPPGPRAPVNSGSGGSVSVRRCSKSAATTETETDGGVEVSFGENVLDVEDRDRNVRETTPCSLIRDSETVRTPGSTTRPTNSTATNRRMQNSTHTNIPTACEMEEFFARAEQLQQRIFMDKYNFDPVNDCPLPGRYEWVKLDCLGSTSSSGNSFPAASPSVSAQDFERR